MKGDTQENESPEEAELMEKLLAGERVWTQRSSYMTLVTAFLSFGSVALLALLWGIHTGYVSAENESGHADVAGITIGYVFTAAWLSLTAYCWGGIAFSSLQLSATSLLLWDWRGRAHEVALADIVAAVSYGRSNRGYVFWRTEICHADSSARGGFRWMTVVQGTDRKLTASSVRDELARRCRLEESGPLENWPRMISVWRRPGSDRDIPRHRSTWLMIGT